MLKIYNTYTGGKEPFVPIEPGKVGIYVCGMTVYDFCHLGHARVMVVFDTVVRYLRHMGLQVSYVRNITDIDDKIIRRAAQNGESVGDLTARFIDAMHEDETRLGVLRPDSEPRATDSIEAIISMIGRLKDAGFAYVGSNGDVFYSVGRFKNYGLLSGRNIDDLRVGERVDVDEAKADPLDFVLWKMAKPGEPQWDSPWGPGRPGWHIECSAMSTTCLGSHFDIHGGGMDLQFPHHENEIAQSEGATGEKFVNVWMHNGFVRVNEEKMSKSLGNFFTVREVLKRFPPLRAGEIVRFFILNSHYRSPLNYSDENLDDAHAALTRLYTSLRGLEPAYDAAIGVELRERFESAMQDDFNTPVALAVLFELAREINRCKDSNVAEASKLAGVLQELGGILGLLSVAPGEWFKGAPVIQTTQHAQMASPVALSQAFSDALIDELIQQRLDARKNKNWTEADRIRDELKEQGVILEDSASATTWRRE